MFSTSPVPGDTPVKVCDLKPGDEVRMFNGIQDTDTVHAVTNHGLGQYGRRAFTVTFASGHISVNVRGDGTRYLATGPAR